MAQIDHGTGDGHIAFVIGQLVYKRSVNLQSLNGKALEVGQTGIAGTKVVNGQADAQVGQLAQAQENLITVTDQNTFGQLQLNQFGGQMGTGQDASHLLDKAFLLKLRRRHVDRYRDMNALTMPLRYLPHGLTQHPVANGDDKTSVFCHGNEAPWRDITHLGVPPADQRFGTDDGPGGNVHLRLVVQAEVAPHQSLAHGVVQLHAGQQIHVHLALVETHRGTAMLLDAVHGVIGIFDELSHVLPVSGIHRHTDAAGDDEAHVITLKRLRQHFQNALTDDFTRVHIGLVQDDHKLVTAQAGHGVIGAQAFFDAVGHLHQHHVAKTVAQGVIDVLEAVQVNEHDRKAMVVALRHGNGLLDPLTQHHPVGQASQRIAVSQVVDALLVRYGLGEVMRVTNAMHRSAALTRQVNQGHQQGRHRAIGAVVVQHALPPVFDVQPVQNQGQAVRFTRQAEQVGEFFPMQLVGAALHQAAARAVGGEDPVVGIGHKNRVNAGLEHFGSEPLTVFTG